MESLRLVSEGFTFDMAPLQRVSERVASELGSLTRFKAPEFYGAVDTVLARVHDAIMTLERLTLGFKDELAIVQSDALLNRIPTLLADRGLANARNPFGSESVRDILLAADPEVQAAQRKVGEAEVILKFLREKRSSLGNTLHTVRAVLRDDSTSGGLRDQAPSSTKTLDPDFG